MNFPGSQLVGLCWVKVKLQLLAPRAVIRSRVLSAGGCFNNEGVSPAIYLIPIHRTIHCGVVTGTLSLSLLIRMLYLHPLLILAPLSVNLSFLLQFCCMTQLSTIDYALDPRQEEQKDHLKP